MPRVEDALAKLLPSAWLVFGISALLLVAAAELGFHSGRQRRRETPRAATASQLGGVQAAVLGLLALLLGFTFAMSVARYDERRALVVKEANAIGTTYLRAGFLPEPTGAR